MVKIALELNANLENLVHLEPADDSFVWYLKVKCGGCGEVNDHWVSVELESRHVSPQQASARLDYVSSTAW